MTNIAIESGHRNSCFTLFHSMVMFHMFIYRMVYDLSKMQDHPWKPYWNLNPAVKGGREIRHGGVMLAKQCHKPSPKWRFPEMGVPPSHLSLIGFSGINYKPSILGHLLQETTKSP